MKMIITFLLLICIGISLGETILRDWQSYTNSTHIAGIEADGDRLLLATWGGLLEYDLEANQFYGPLKMEDGLTEHELSSIEISQKGILLLGTKGGGINRIEAGEFKMPLSMENGLPANDVYKIKSGGNNKFVALTSTGISVFSDLPVWPLPTVRNYDLGDGLSSERYYAISINENNYVYCGSANGIEFANLFSEEQEWVALESINNELEDTYITSLYSNGLENVAATKSGIIKWTDPPLGREIERFGESVPYFPVFVDDEGNIWTSKGWWDEENLAVQESTEEMIIRISENGTETVWAQSELGCLNSMVTDIEEVNGKIIVSTWGDGILLYDGTSWEGPFSQNCIGVNFTTALQMDYQNRLWVGNGVFSNPDHSRANRGVSVWDGFEWRTFDSRNSGLMSNNINSIVPLDNDVFWFTSYTNDLPFYSGVNILDYSDEANPAWEFHHYSMNNLPVAPLPTGNVGNSFRARDGNVWLTCYNGGITVRNAELEEVDYFYAPDVLYNDNPNVIHSYQGDFYSVMGGWLSGFEIWLGNEVPQTENTANWLQPDNRDFKNGHVFDAVERHQQFEEQIWIASSLALYMYDGETWYRYGKESTKRQYLDESAGSPDWQPKQLIPGVNDSPDWWYFEGQERLYGGENTYPTVLLVDPFNNLWIGTESNGICRYDIQNNKFKTWNTLNSPLLADKINDLEYDKETGLMYIATDRGLNSVRIGISADDNSEKILSEILVYPNPFYPERDGLVRIENKEHLSMPAGGTKCHIYDLEGLLVRELPLNFFQQFEWDGNNSAGKACSSGIYFYLVTGGNKESGRGKIILVR